MCNSPLLLDLLARTAVNPFQSVLVKFRASLSSPTPRCYFIPTAKVAEQQLSACCWTRCWSGGVKSTIKQPWILWSLWARIKETSGKYTTCCSAWNSGWKLCVGNLGWPVHLNTKSVQVWRREKKKGCGDKSIFAATVCPFSLPSKRTVSFSCISHRMENAQLLWQLFALTRCLDDGSCVNRTKCECAVPAWGCVMSLDMVFFLSVCWVAGDPRPWLLMCGTSPAGFKAPSSTQQHSLPCLSS